MHFFSQVRDECKHPVYGVCSPRPGCEGKKCFMVTPSTLLTSGFVDRFSVYTGDWLVKQPDLDAVLTNMAVCGTNFCSRKTFQMHSSASQTPTPLLGSYTGRSVKLQDGDIVAHRNIVCHGAIECDQRFGATPNPGRVITLDEELPFVVQSRHRPPTPPTPPHSYAPEPGRAAVRNPAHRRAMRRCPVCCAVTSRPPGPSPQHTVLDLQGALHLRLLCLLLLDRARRRRTVRRRDQVRSGGRAGRGGKRVLQGRGVDVAAGPRAAGAASLSLPAFLWARLQL
jgi:hypothetical protein